MNNTFINIKLFTIIIIHQMNFIERYKNRKLQYLTFFFFLFFNLNHGNFNLGVIQMAFFRNEYAKLKGRAKIELNVATCGTECFECRFCQTPSSAKQESTGLTFIENVCLNFIRSFQHRKFVTVSSRFLLSMGLAYLFR